MVVRSYTRKTKSLSLGLLLLFACSGSINAGLTDWASNLTDQVKDVFHQDEAIELPSLSLPKANTFYRFFALNGMLGALKGTPSKWLPTVVKKALSSVDSEDNINGMSEIFASALATTAVSGALHTNKVRAVAGAALIAVVSRWVDTALRLTPWTKDLACPNAKCKGLCDDCKMHKANVGLWAYGIASGAVNSAVAAAKNAQAPAAPQTAAA